MVQGHNRWSRRVSTSLPAHTTIAPSPCHSSNVPSSCALWQVCSACSKGATPAISSGQAAASVLGSCASSALTSSVYASGCSTATSWCTVDKIFDCKAFGRCGQHPRTAHAPPRCPRTTRCLAFALAAAHLSRHTTDGRVACRRRRKLAIACEPAGHPGLLGHLLSEPRTLVCGSSRAIEHVRSGGDACA